PIEALEKEYPLLIERYELVEDSGGAGTWRGGLGLRRVYRGLGHTVVFSGQGERCVHRPWGLFGGGPGATGKIQIVHDDGRLERLPNKCMSVEVPTGAVVWIETPGAGGYGPPAQRSPELVEEDARRGKFSARFIREKYGSPRARSVEIESNDGDRIR